MATSHARAGMLCGKWGHHVRTVLYVVTRKKATGHWKGRLVSLELNATNESSS